MSSNAATPRTPDHEALTCPKCGRPVRMRNGRPFSCQCGSPAPKTGWTLRAVPASGDEEPPVAWIEHLENANKACTNPACDGWMVFHFATKKPVKAGARGSSDAVQAWTCCTCGRQEVVTPS